MERTLAVVLLAVCASAQAGPNERISVATEGAQAMGASYTPAISEDGRYVVFLSDAPNLVPGDTNLTADVFRRDRWLGATEAVSTVFGDCHGTFGTSGPAASGDASVVAWATDCLAGVVPEQILVRDLGAGGAAQVVSVAPGGALGNEASLDPAISADGRFVAFSSFAWNLVAGDTNGHQDVFVLDRVSGSIERASVRSNGAQANQGSLDPALSADGRFVAFMSSASNLVPGDTNGWPDVFVQDRATGLTQRVSVDSAGAEADGWCADPAISADGRFVAFSSVATNLVPGDANGAFDVFVRDRLTSTTRRVSVDSSGTEGNDDSTQPSLLSAAGLVAFQSRATNLVPGDGNGVRDVFVHALGTGETRRTSVGPAGGGSDGDAWSPALSGDGRFVAFHTDATNLVPGDTNGDSDVFVRALAGGVGAAYCFGDGAGTPCPCGNEADPGEGCANSSGAGGRIAGWGSTSVAADDLGVWASGLLPGQPALLFAGHEALNGGDGLPFGDGLRCAGGGVVRLDIQDPDGTGLVGYGPGLAAQGGFGAGDLRRFQVWYRDLGGPCGSGFGLTPGLEIAFGA